MKYVLNIVCVVGLVVPAIAQDTQTEQSKIKPENASDGTLDRTTIVGSKPLIETEPSNHSKLLNSIAETPRSVDIVNRKQIEERGAQSVQDTLGYTAGVFAGPFGFDLRIDDARIRGLSPLYYRDGFQSNFRFYNTARAEIYATERVEVIKGASSILYGQGALC